MIEIEIPQDIRKYEAKLIGPFTTRQLLCTIGLVIGCVISYKAATSLFGSDSSLRTIFPMIVAIPFGLVGFYKPYGMPFEKFAKSVFVSMFLAPTKRLYKIKNTHDEFDKIIDNEEKAKLAKENPQLAKTNSKDKKKERRKKK